MNSTPPSSRFVRIAARSPARSSAGPLVGCMRAPISVAMMPASVVLPRPGGPANSTWSTAWPRLPRRGEHDLEVLAQARLADEVVEAARAAASSLRPPPPDPLGLAVFSRPPAFPRSPAGSSGTGQHSQRVAQQLLDRAVLAELAEHRAHLVGRIAETDRARRAPRRAAWTSRRWLRRGRGREARGAPSARSSRRCAVRLPTPGTSTSASRSSSARPRRSVFGVCTDRIASASFGPTPVAEISDLERVAFVAGREAVEHHRVLAHVQVREQERVAPGIERGHDAERDADAVADAADLDEHLAARRALDHRAPHRADHLVPTCPPVISSRPARRAARARGGSTRARARRPRRAASGSRGGSAARATIICTAALSARPSPVTASFTSLGLYSATGIPDRAAATSASPLACPTDIAVRTFAWNSTRSTATADGRVSAISEPQLVVEREEPVRAADRRGACG